MGGYGNLIEAGIQFFQHALFLEKRVFFNDSFHVLAGKHVNLTTGICNYDACGSVMLKYQLRSEEVAFAYCLDYAVGVQGENFHFASDDQENVFRNFPL